MKRRAWPPLLGLLYIVAVGILGGLRGDHVLIGLLGFLDLYNEKSRSFLREFFPFILAGVIFDSMRYFYWQGIEGHVHVAGPYYFERDWFGYHGKTLNEWTMIHHCAALDLATGFAYLFYVGEFILVAIGLFLFGKLEPVRVLARSFLVVNLMGFATYFIFPVAPPWYITQYGLGPARMDVQPNQAAAARFDKLLGTHFFDEMYGRGVDVFGAYPSLHVAYPLIVMLVVFRLPYLRWLRVPSVLFFLLMCVSAIYLQHHYVTDALLGFSYALITLAIVRQWLAARASSAHPIASGSSVVASASLSARE